jgi:hypothetical protein
MKASIIFFIALFAGISANTFGQVSQEAAKGNQNKQDTLKNQIFIDAKGGIHDHGGTKLGYIDKDNIARNTEGQKVYFIDKYGNVFDRRGWAIGKASKDGTFYTSDSVAVLSTRDKDDQTCEIIDPKGHSMGTTHKNYKLHACAAHCFFLDDKGKKKD